MINLADAIKDKMVELGIKKPCNFDLIKLDGNGNVFSACMIGLAALAVGIPAEEIIAEAKKIDANATGTENCQLTRVVAEWIDERLGCEVMMVDTDLTPRRASIKPRRFYEWVFRSNDANEEVDYMLDTIREQQEGTCDG